jgi:hypothetical protein
VIDQAIDVAEDAGVALSINLTGGVFVNQSAAFSDFHGTGAEPGGQCGADRRAFVASRFRVVQHRRTLLSATLLRSLPPGQAQCSALRTGP